MNCARGFADSNRTGVPIPPIGHHVTPAKAGAYFPTTLVHYARKDLILTRWVLGWAAVKQPCVYLLANRREGALYVGVTSNLVKRIFEHRNDLRPGFTSEYRIHRLVWFERHDSMESAIRREKAMKEWRRAWKIALIEKANPEWTDLYPDVARG